LTRPNLDYPQISIGRINRNWICTCVLEKSAPFVHSWRFVRCTYVRVTAVDVRDSMLSKSCATVGANSRKTSDRTGQQCGVDVAVFWDRRAVAMLFRSGARSSLGEQSYRHPAAPDADPVAVEILGRWLRSTAKWLHFGFVRMAGCT